MSPQASSVESVDPDDYCVEEATGWDRSHQWKWLTTFTTLAYAQISLAYFRDKYPWKKFRIAVYSRGELGCIPMMVLG